jgi:hypothetical protein
MEYGLASDRASDTGSSGTFSLLFTYFVQGSVFLLAQLKNPLMYHLSEKLGHTNGLESSEAVTAFKVFPVLIIEYYMMTVGW